MLLNVFLAECAGVIFLFLGKPCQPFGSGKQRIPHQQLLTTFLGKMIDLYSVLCHYFADAMAEVDRVAEDEGEW